MTPAEINQTIAEFMGWIRLPSAEVDAEMLKVGGPVWYRRPGEKTICAAGDMPDYYQDLNAIQGAIAFLPDSAHNAFQREVAKYLISVLGERQRTPIDFMLAPADIWARACVKAIWKRRNQ
jgi:hypothetical protein